MITILMNNDKMYNNIKRACDGYECINKDTIKQFELSFEMMIVYYGECTYYIINYNGDKIPKDGYVFVKDEFTSDKFLKSQVSKLFEHVSYYSKSICNLDIEIKYDEEDEEDVK